MLLCKGQMVYAVRERCGRQLALEANIEADIVSTVPESATPAALGYSQQVGSSYVMVMYCSSHQNLLQNPLWQIKVILNAKTLQFLC